LLVIKLIAKEKILQLIQGYLNDKDIFLVDLQVSSSNKIQVFIDGPKGILVSDCVGLSRHIEASLDREQEDFELEVSSPGADAPIKVPGQYEKNIGRTLRVIDQDGAEYIGRLASIQSETITLEPAKSQGKNKQKKTNTEPVTLELAKVKQASVILSFK
jgi:ribosome maturation factor RimP